jgi:hypothetical protein
MKKLKILCEIVMEDEGKEREKLLRKMNKMEEYSLFTEDGRTFRVFYYE